MLSFHIKENVNNTSFCVAYKLIKTIYIIYLRLTLYYTYIMHTDTRASFGEGGGVYGCTP